MAELVPVEHDPFSGDQDGGSLPHRMAGALVDAYRSYKGTNPKLVPVDGDPFAMTAEDQAAMMPETYVNPAVKGAIESVATLPRRAIEGAEQYRPGSGEAPDAAVSPALETALLMVGGAGAVPMEANTLRTGVGVLSKGAHLKKLPQFERLEGKGVSPEMNYAMSGWYRGGDDMPRYWISDEGAKLTDKMQQLQSGDVGLPSIAWRKESDAFDAVRLGDVWEHSKLYAAHPWLKDIKVESAPSSYYDYNNKTIKLREGSPKTVHDTLHHEAIHAIQHREGFAWGGGHEQFVPKNIKEAEPHLEAAQNHLDESLQRETGWNPFSARMVATMRPAEMNAEQLAAYNTMKEKGLLDQLDQIHVIAQKVGAAKDESYARYLHLHGESEARDAPFLRNNPKALKRGQIPLHVNPEMTPGRKIEVTPAPPWKLKPVDHDPFPSSPGPPRLKNFFAGESLKDIGETTEQIWQQNKGKMRGINEQLDRLRTMGVSRGDWTTEEVAEIEAAIKEKAKSPFVNQAKLDRAAEKAADKAERNIGFKPVDHDPFGAPPSTESSLNTIRAYHGSPHEIDEFDISRNLQGAGGTFGYGHSLAENPDFASAFTRLKPQEGIPAKPTLHEVMIDASPEYFVDFNKSFAEQSPKVQDVLRQMKKETGASFGKNSAGFDIYDALKTTLKGGDKEMTKRLAEAGIRGLRYEEVRGEANYTVFDNKYLKITRRDSAVGFKPVDHDPFGER